MVTVRMSSCRWDTAVRHELSCSLSSGQLFKRLRAYGQLALLCQSHAVLQPTKHWYNYNTTQHSSKLWVGGCFWNDVVNRNNLWSSKSLRQTHTAATVNCIQSRSNNIQCFSMNCPQQVKIKAGKQFLSGLEGTLSVPWVYRECTVSVSTWDTHDITARQAQS